VYRSSDGGDAWMVLRQGLPAERFFCMAHYGQYLYAGARRGGVYKSQDNGETWQQSKLVDVLGPVPINAIAAGDGFIIAGSSSLRLYRSTDNGESWKSIENRIPKTFGISTMGALLTIGNSLFMGTDWGMARTTDLGETWDTLNAGMVPPGIYVPDIRLTATHMVAGGHERWIWRRPLSELLPPAGLEVITSPYGLRLEQSIPNPSASTAEISYTLSAPGSVTLKLYDAIMREVVTVVDGHEDAGYHRTSVDVATYPAGVYYYRLTSGASVLTRRMVVLR
jgi:hypothetical protein